MELAVNVSDGAAGPEEEFKLNIVETNSEDDISLFSRSSSMKSDQSDLVSVKGGTGYFL